MKAAMPKRHATQAEPKNTSAPRGLREQFGASSIRCVASYWPDWKEPSSAPRGAMVHAGGRRHSAGRKSFCLGACRRHPDSACARAALCHKRHDRRAAAPCSRASSVAIFSAACSKRRIDVICDPARERQRRAPRWLSRREQRVIEAAEPQPDHQHHRKLERERRRRPSSAFADRARASRPRPPPRRSPHRARARRSAARSGARSIAMPASFAPRYAATTGRLEAIGIDDFVGRGDVRGRRAAPAHRRCASPSGVRSAPAATGFMPATRSPRRTSARISAVATSVLPTRYRCR